MAKIGLFYGSTSGFTEKVAEQIAELLGKTHEVDLTSMEDIGDLDDLLEYDNLVLGSSTWGQGDLQNDWRDPYTEMDDADFSGKTVALFGTGDCDKHGEHFVSALGHLYHKLTERGAKVVGLVDPSGYTFESSLAVVDGKFVGLPIDDINEEEKTPARIEAWVKQIEGAF